MDSITVQKRDTSLKAKQLRRNGITPCVICGSSLPESISIQMDKNEVIRLFKSKREGSQVQIVLDGKKISAQIKEKSRDTISNEITHVNFQALDAHQKSHSIAHVVLHNADKVKGDLEKMLLEIPYSALPSDMIDTISIDLANRPAETTITVGDIKELMTKKIELLVETDSIIVRISEKKEVIEDDAEKAAEPSAPETKPTTEA
ncbi:MAG: 50S ribosomal protein L25/general stress protein Ctc [Clostridia bacterium]